jgi:soluble lytic murein transglycosylase-like protein
MFKLAAVFKTLLVLTLYGGSSHAASQSSATSETATTLSPHAAEANKRSDHADMIKRYAEWHRIPLALVDAIIATVNQSRAGAIGRFGEVGLRQIHPAAARQYGFTGGKVELAELSRTSGTARLI